MLIRLDMASATPIYVQLRNQIVMGIGTGALCAAAQSDCDGNRHGCIEGRGKASDCPADGGRCGSQHHDGK